MPAIDEARVRRVGVAWAIALAVVFAALASAVNAGSLHLSDQVLLTVAQAPGGTVLDWTMALVSALGMVEVTGVLVLVLAVTARSARPLGWRRWVPAGVFIAVVLLEIAGKAVIHQPAPPAYLLRGPRLPGLSATTAYSFPSGHMVRITLVFGLAALRLARHTRQMRWLTACIAAVWLVGFSRVYLGEHWPADVAGGILLGGVGIALCLAISPRGSVGDLAPSGPGPGATARP